MPNRSKWITPHDAGRFYHLKQDSYDMRRWLAVQWRKFAALVDRWITP